MDYGRLRETAEHYGAEYGENVLLAPYTTFRIGGPCDVMIKPPSAECLAELIKVCKEDNVPFRMLGKGSNVLVSDEGVGCAVFVPEFSSCTVQGDKLVLNVGFSHPVEFVAPAGIKFECPTLTEVNVCGISKELVGQTAANIRAIRVPEPYHGYGIRYKGENVEHKESDKGKK